jgi:hypothetical protein
MRQLEQDVKDFWNYKVDQSKNTDGSTNMKAAIALASKIVGRWLSGAPLTCSPDHDHPSLAEENNFLFEFQKEENFGKCPLVLTLPGLIIAMPKLTNQKNPLL